VLWTSEYTSESVDKERKWTAVENNWLAVSGRTRTVDFPDSNGVPLTRVFEQLILSQRTSEDMSGSKKDSPIMEAVVRSWTDCSLQKAPTSSQLVVEQRAYAKTRALFQTLVEHHQVHDNQVQDHRDRH
jgi:hypothetical protein